MGSRGGEPAGAMAGGQRMAALVAAASVAAVGV